MRPCNRIGCKEAATHALKLVVPSGSGMRLTAAEGLLGVEMCERHFEEAELDGGFVSHPQVQRLFLDVIEDGTDPAWDDAYLDAVQIDGPEYKAWRSMACAAN